eukprot:GILJ01024151.1.p1 GENE.GILJ01024151.1~~GILJ01024151.1.p1  ORF type:complete len:106 (+),score=4.38 GILJ01024151.1:342-659(+)
MTYLHSRHHDLWKKLDSEDLHILRVPDENGEIPKQHVKVILGWALISEANECRFIDLFQSFIPRIGIGRYMVQATRAILSQKKYVKARRAEDSEAFWRRVGVQIV